MYIRMSGLSLVSAALIVSGAVSPPDNSRSGLATHLGVIAHASENEQGRFVGLRLEHMDFSDRDLRGANFSLSRLIAVDFAGAMLSGSNFSSSVFEEVDFSGANLEVTSFRGARLAGVDFTGANLQGACFVDADLSDVDFTGADLSGAVMSESQRKAVTLKDAVIKNTIWNGRGECPRGNRKFADLRLPGT